MGNAVFPTLIGLTWDIVKTPMWSTRIQRSVSGRELRAAFYNYPLWRWTLSYDLLRDDSSAELKTLVAFFNQRKGSYDSFLYDDPSDNLITGQSLGTGDGSTTTFQMIRSYGGYIEPFSDIKASPVPKIFLNAVLQTTGYSISNGIVTFTPAPGLGVAVTADFGYYHRVRFNQDEAEFSQFAYQLWELKSIELVSVR